MYFNLFHIPVIDNFLDNLIVKITSSEALLYFQSGVRNAAQRKLYDELGIVAADAPVDDFTFLGRILYKAPSDGKWGEHERK